MSRLVKKSIVLLVAPGDVTMAPGPSSGQGGSSARLPPNANFRGKSFAGWNVLLVKLIYNIN
jgi:hypothetical protein